MLSLNSVIVFSENPQGLVDFYKKVFQTDPEWSGGDFHGFKVGSGYLVIGPHDKVQGKNTTPERMMFNFETADVEAEFNRIKELGATVIANPYHPTESKDDLLSTFSDPDGNYFQIVTWKG